MYKRQVEGSSGGTITNMDGKFSISLPKNKTSLKFSYVGFATQTVSVKNKKEVRVVMHEDLQQLDEVVVDVYKRQEFFFSSFRIHSPQGGNISLRCVA